ncbi:MAG: OmpH family outer membrane protein [Odoribacteraceae bacterium]|jgi:outer membrane protein|nr:OmpH family outer membrane protein [Odoribacteraceae bacterium]
MKKSIQLVMLVAFVFAAVTVSAQSVKPIKLGHIETEKLMEIMPEVKKAEGTARAKGEEYQKTLEEMLTQRITLVKDYQDNEKTYSEVKKKSLEQEIADLERRIQQFRENAEVNLRSTQEELFKPIFEKIQKAIKQVGDENSFTYIFEIGSGAINYVSPASEDVLPLVKKKLGLL